MTVALTRREFLAGLAALPAAAPVRSAEVRVVDGVPLLFVNDEPRNPLMYFAGPHRVPDLRDGGGASAMTAEAWPRLRPNSAATIPIAAGTGFHLHSLSVWFPWPKPGETADYSDAETSIHTVLERDPEALILLRFNLDPPRWWRDANPEELSIWDNGESLSPRVENSNHLQMGTEVSVASEVWRQQACDHLARFVTHLESKFCEHILGYHACGQNTHEWFLMDSHLAKLNCCEPAFLNSWRSWLRSRYATAEDLRAAWRESEAGFESITLPTREQRVNARIGCFRDPAVERKLIDFHEYQNVAVVEALERFARVIKANSRKLVVFFYGYLFELSHQPHGPQQSGHLALGRLLECPDVDVICGPLSYDDRAVGGIGGFMPAVDSLGLRGKLWCTEDDTRTHLAPRLPAGQSPLANPEETRAVHLRNFSHLLPRRATCWWMDLGGEGWLCDKNIWHDLARLRVIYDRALEQPPSFSPEIAVIVDEKSNYHLTQKQGSITDSLMYTMRRSLYRIGAPSGYYLLADLSAGRVAGRKLYIFLNCFAMTPAERAAIVSQCLGVTCVFFYGNGFLADTADITHMSALLGTQVTVSMDTVAARIQLSSPIGGVRAFGADAPLAPVFLADPNRVEVLGTYMGGLPAMWKSAGEYNSIYIGALTAPPDVLRALARDASVHLYVESNDVVEVDGRFLVIHASTSGRKQLRLPGPRDVTDAWNGHIIGTGISEWQVDMVRGETRLYSW